MSQNIKYQIENALSQKENEFKFEGKWTSSKSVYEAADNADAIIVVTEWKEFRSIKLKEISNLMRKPSWIFDLRSVINIQEAKSCGINVWKLGLGVYKMKVIASLKNKSIV